MNGCSGMADLCVPLPLREHVARGARYFPVVHFAIASPQMSQTMPDG
eukprot:CAMPEP_0119324676 /NCGR_PEP_ID=MMETSP1333-20130426/63912_1 /TAXON_ID=418940 /ORGANISM="Scyphosphaera apsteinii, Strain RCC1455" /LENGTH=46 /DNA_ID= /DNA_START= /DNA_END= /DNA_ORIENTATION=